MKRFLTCLLLAVLIVCALSVSATADSLYIKKIVSVVYDNSGSMTDGADGNTSYDKQAYANYAMQTFCGLLNSEDRLFITYMNNKKYVDNGIGYSGSPETIEVELSASEIQNSIKDIQSRASKGGTPWSAVDMAAKKLESIKDDNANTQYWLVVITDGEFNEVDDKQYDEQVDFLNEKLSQISHKTMPNGQAPRIVFFSINSEGGKSIPTPEESEVEGLTVYEAQSAKEISEQMSKIADKVSGRTRLTGSDIEKVGANSVKVTSQFPLLNIVALAQNTTAKVKEIKVSSEVDTDIKRKVELQYVGADSQKYPTLKGTACLIGLKDGAQKVIPAGSYTIAFDGAVNDDLVILFEPALEMRTTFTVNGKTVTDHKELKELAEGDTISISSKIYEMWTDNEISADKLPKGTEFKSEISINGTPVVTSGKEMLIENYVLTSDETVIESTVRMTGFAPIEYKTTVYPKKPSVYEVRVATGTSTVNFDSISDGNFSVTFEIYRDNKRIVDPEAIKALYPKVTASPSGNELKTEITDTGKIVVTPTSANENGGKDYTVTVRCDTDKGSGEASYKVVFSTYEVRAVSKNETLNFDKAKDNKDVSVRFEVYRDGKQITDAAEIEALNPKITVSPSGNDGTTEIIDGKIVFTPNSARAESDGVDYTVTVTCNTDKGGAEAEYKVVFSNYEIRPVEKGVTLNFDKVADNDTVGVSFEVYCDGKRLTDADEVNALDPKITVSPAGNNGVTEVTGDGKIVFIPNSARAESDGADYDVTVTCTTDKGSANATYSVIFSKYEVKAVDKDVSIRHLDVSSNQDVKLTFEVYKDGELITSAAEVEALGVTVEAAPEGNMGVHEITADGKIVFTPKAVSGSFDGESFDVSVTCRAGKVSAVGTYKVLCSSYEIVPVGTQESIKYEEVAQNKDFKVYFQLIEDGKPVTDPERIIAMGYDVTSDVQGNGGVKGVEADGRISFTPNQAYTSDLSIDLYEVKLKCRVGNTVGEHGYTVLIANYEIFPTNGAEKVEKTDLFENDVSVSFYITKDDVRLTKSDLEGAVLATLNDEWKDVLLTDMSISDDGTITVIPYDDEKIDKGFFKWIWIFDYLCYPGEDVSVTLVTPFGKSEARIDVVHADIFYILIWVLIPALVDIAIGGYIGWWIISVLRREHYAKNTNVYFADLIYESEARTNKRTVGGVGKLEDMYQETSWLGAFLYRIFPPISKKVNVKKTEVNNGVYISPRGKKGLYAYCEGEVCAVTSVKFTYKEGGSEISEDYPMPDVLAEMVSKANNNSRVVCMNSKDTDISIETRNSSGSYTLSSNMYYVVDAVIGKTSDNKQVINGGTIIYFEV